MVETGPRPDTLRFPSPWHTSLAKLLTFSLRNGRNSQMLSTYLEYSKREDQRAGRHFVQAASGSQSIVTSVGVVFAGFSLLAPSAPNALPLGVAAGLFITILGMTGLWLVDGSMKKCLISPAIESTGP